MNITKDMVHPDLRSVYGFLKAMTFLNKRRWFMKMTDRISRFFLEGKNIEGLRCEEHQITSSDGHYQIRTRIYRPDENSEKLPGLLYIHGGGYIIGLPETSHMIIERFIQTRPCVIVSPDYRKAFTKPYPAGFNDCYETLLWMKNNAEELGIRDDQFIIAGHSAGGGLTAAVTLKARDTGDVNIAFQMPIYPMIDDQQPQDDQRQIDVPVWDTELNAIGWNAYLDDLLTEGADIPAYAAPARNTNYEGFPPTITFVGTREPFYQETADYVKSLQESDIEVAYREYEGCFHAFDFLGKGVADDAKAFTYDQYADFYDRHLR